LKIKEIDMLGYWETKIRNRTLFLYSLSPFLEEVGILLLGAKNLWHPWSVKRLEQLNEIAYALKDRAEIMRQRGLGWASNVSKFGEDTAYLLGSSVYHRWHDRNSSKASCPEATPYLVSAATGILSVLLPVFQKVEELSWEESGKWVKWLSEIGETLMEFPCIDPKPEISEKMIRAIGVHAILLECEGLAAMQARIEDDFVERNKIRRKKKKINLSDAELRKLADEIDMPFEAVKEAMETECSSWWNKANEYGRRADAQKEIFLSSLSAENQIREAIRTVWDSGMITNRVRPKCWDEAELLKSEQIIKTLISMFLSIADKEKMLINSKFLKAQ